MTRALVLLGLMVLAVRGIAQSGIPDMPFSINFSELSGSPSDSELLGSANYFRVKQYPNYFPPPYDHNYTNQLEVWIDLPAPPKEAWILEQEEDGSLNRVFEVTNLSVYDSHQLIFDQSFTLTTNQIQSLIEGNWYAEIGFGNSNYLGNLAPAYDFANGPKVVMVFPPINGYPSRSYFVISPNNRTARFVFDGSHCVDPFYLPMQFFWTGWTVADFNYGVSDPLFTDTGMFATNAFDLGSYIIGLQVNDPIVDGRPYYFPLQVITAGQAVNMIIPDIQWIPEPKKQNLIRVLSTAVVFFNRGHMIRGCIELKVYQKQVESLHYDSTITHNLTGPAQDIIDVFQNEFRNGNKNRFGDSLPILR